ncbi:Cu(I)-responsive transcriptional regulator [Photobacterium carnosum]|jgi:MerR family copper efflux transcriptional regulator|nr:Cu(I)-responsive transcriptional regulator [Photobacterium carnosum]MCD9497680.1 Cu(I)-responsive transcriptional regulator [Photobacterium carnosum]MCD9513292.1 Cu(I)-responsive transcriptional regulator [Photobacterium carnosum]MCD9527807.1 Cu(I)-responsive transcriptional regulator [Photobacterium carnosum]MCD9529038.1 Cu(I)-responsive transcriptional regulator [Photobacterium carnosum]
MMSISDVAKQTGLTAKTIRFYETKGVISAAPRGTNGYRYYNASHIAELLLIKRSRMIGFSLDECQQLLALSTNPDRHSRDVKQKAQQKLIEIDHKIEELKQIKLTLSALTDQCPGDKSAHCPILESLIKNG